MGQHGASMVSQSVRRVAKTAVSFEGESCKGHSPRCEQTSERSVHGRTAIAWCLQHSRGDTSLLGSRAPLATQDRSSASSPSLVLHSTRARCSGSALPLRLLFFVLHSMQVTGCKRGGQTGAGRGESRAVARTGHCALPPAACAAIAGCRRGACGHKRHRPNAQAKRSIKATTRQRGNR